MDARRSRVVTPPHAALRAATEAAHERLHHLPQFAGLAGGGLDRAGYRDLLARLLGFHEPIEAAIAARLGDAAFGLPLAGMRRADLLRDDLRQLDAGKAAIVLMPVPAFATASQAMGALYVTEGATLGGRQMARGLDRLLGAGEARGRRFLLAGADPTRPAWRDVRAAIDRCGVDPANLAGLIDGATVTFAAFGAWFGAPPSPGDNYFRPGVTTRRKSVYIG